MYKLFIVCCLLFTVAFKADAKNLPRKPVVKPTITIKQTAIPVYDSLRKDSSKVNLRSFNAVALDKYRNDQDFNYRTEKQELSLWDRFWRWFWEIIDWLFGGKQVSSGPGLPFMKYIIWALALGLLIFAIIKLAGINLSNIFNRESKEIQLPYSESLENIHQITFEDEIEKALTQRNYRLAIRLLYLSTLKQLSDAQLIHWQLEKTNSAYLNELKDSAQRQSFNVLTRQFEYVWYGDFPVDGQSFQNINTLFHDFKKMLK
jgi:hypothetical protein